MDSQTTQEIKKKKKWLLPIILGAVALLLIGIGVGGFIYIKSVALPKKEVQRNLDLGDKYLTDMDYEKAVLSYKEAITIDPKNVKAYVGLGDAYLAWADELTEEGDTEEAIKKLKKGIKELKPGIDETGSDDIKEKKEELEKRKKEIEGGEDSSESINKEAVKEDNPVDVEELNRKAENLISDFLNGSGKARLKADDSEFFNANEGLVSGELYTLEQIRNKDGYYSYIETKYAYVDFGHDGIQDLVVDIVETDDINNYDRFYFIMFLDDELQIVNSYQTFFRMSVMVNKYGVCRLGFSGAPAEPYDGSTWYDIERINQNGKCEPIYSFDHRLQLPEPFITLISPYDQEYDWNNLKYGNIEHQIYTLGKDTDYSDYEEKVKKSYHVFVDGSGNVVYPSEEKMSEYTSKGIEITDFKGWENALNSYMDSIGMNRDDLIMDGNLADWRKLN